MIYKLGWKLLRKARGEVIEEGKGKEIEKEDAVDIHCVIN